MKPIPGETTVPYATRLREKSQDCEFGDSSQSDERILEHLIQTIENESLIQKCISKGWNLSQFLTEAGQIEDISLHMRDIKMVDQEKQIAKIDRSKQQKWKNAERYADRKIDPYAYCGFKRVHTDRRSCPAYGKKCAKCQKPNHFATVCRADRYRNLTNKNKTETKRGRNRIKKTLEHESDSAESDEDFLAQSIAHMTIKKVQNRYSLEKTAPLMINDIPVRAEPDSGADVNVVDEFQFRVLKHRSAEDLELQSSKNQTYDTTK